MKAYTPEGKGETHQKKLEKKFGKSSRKGMWGGEKKEEFTFLGSNKPSSLGKRGGGGRTGKEKRARDLNEGETS